MEHKRNTLEKERLCFVFACCNWHGMASEAGLEQKMNRNKVWNEQRYTCVSSWYVGAQDIMTQDNKKKKVLHRNRNRSSQGIRKDFYQIGRTLDWELTPSENLYPDTGTVMDGIL